MAMVAGGRVTAAEIAPTRAFPAPIRQTSALWDQVVAGAAAQIPLLPICTVNLAGPSFPKACALAKATSGRI